MVDSPAWHLVKALNTLVSEDGNTDHDRNYPKPRPLSAEEKEMIAESSKARSEAQPKKQLGVQHWIDDLPWEQANERLESQPTVNIEGLVGGYTGPGGKTVLPHRAVAKIDMRLVPDMKADDALAALKAHLAKRGFGDIEVNMSGGYDPTSTSASAPLIQAQVSVLKAPESIRFCGRAMPARIRVMSLQTSRSNSQLDISVSAMAAVRTRRTSITSSSRRTRRFRDIDGAVMSFVEYLYELAK